MESGLNEANYFVKVNSALQFFIKMSISNTLSTHLSFEKQNSDFQSQFYKWAHARTPSIYGLSFMDS